MDKIRCLINICIACLLYPFTKKRFEGKKIWLVGGNAGELFVDNSRAMYEYLRARKNVEELWVLNKNSEIRGKIPGEILIKGSIKAYLYFINAEVVLFSHSVSAHIAPYLFVVPFVNRFHYKPLKVFLNHGTVGFKVRKAMNPKTEKIAEKLVRSYDINIADSDYEKKVKTDSWWNIPEGRTFITGYPRYDRLYNVKVETAQIFFMPTWRNWIRPETVSIEETEYFRNITGLLVDKRLNRFLEEKNIKLNIYIHQLMHGYLDKFKNISFGKNVTLLPKDTDITKELMKSDILITDYSSVAYDYLYLGKPIIFFQFDKDEYENKVGSYVNLENDLFGEEAHTVSQCVDKIIKIVDNGYKYDGIMQKKVSRLKGKFLKYTDKENCKRVYELIESKLGERNGKRQSFNNNSHV